MNKDIKIQRRIESQFLNFLAQLKKQEYAPATLQVYFASIRSFFEIHYLPLRIRKWDYPKGDSDGSVRATKEALINVTNRNSPSQLSLNSTVLTGKDSGLRANDLRRLNCDIILQHTEIVLSYP